MPTLTTTQLKNPLKSAKETAANKLQSAGKSTKDTLKKAAEKTQHAGNKLILLFQMIIAGKAQALMILLKQLINWVLKFNMTKEMALLLLERCSVLQRS